MSIKTATKLLPSSYRAVSVKTDKDGKLIRHKSKMSNSLSTIKEFIPAPGTVALGIYEITSIRDTNSSNYTYRGFDITCFDEKTDHLMVDVMTTNADGCEFHGSRESLALALDYIDAYRYKHPAAGDVPVCDLGVADKREWWAITHTDRHGTRYLAWQNPAWDDSGYFWTQRETFVKVLRNSTTTHPFIFKTRDMAYAWLRMSNIRVQCKVIKIKVKPDTVLNDPEQPGGYAHPGISADILVR